MNRQRMLVSAFTLGLLLALAIGPGLAQEPERQSRPAELLAINANVASTITYQGQLLEDGVPVNTPRDLTFQFYGEDTCVTPVGPPLVVGGVPMVDGFFTAYVPVPTAPATMNGQGRWLSLSVGETVVVACQEILPVPYALSLRPGATIIGDAYNSDGLHVENSSSGGSSYGVYGRSASPGGVGLFGFAAATTGSAHGVYGRSDSAAGAGVYARGAGDSADLLLGGRSTSQDNGTISTEPAYPSADLLFYSNDEIWLHMDEDDGEAGETFRIYNGANQVVFEVDESGNVACGGPGQAAFPRPAHDSGWQILGLGAASQLAHNLGGNTDNYVVDLTCRRPAGGGAGVNNWGVGGDANWEEYYGAWWSNLTTTTITIHRWNDDSDCSNVRVRIWMYQ